VPAVEVGDFVYVAGNGSVSLVKELASLIATSNLVWEAVTANHFPNVRSPCENSVSCEDWHKAAQARLCRRERQPLPP
jgi:hypothetical protein